MAPPPIADRPHRHPLDRPGGPEAGLVLTAAMGAVVFAVLLLFSGGIYDAVTDSDGIAVLDRPALNLAISLRTPGRDALITALTNLGGTVPMVILGITLTAVLFWKWRRRTILVLIGLAAAGSIAFTIIGKTIVGRTRPALEFAVPPFEYAPSFPSGHTLNSTVVAGMLAYLVWWLARTWRARILAATAAAMWAGSIGLSRVYLGHHWLTDVIFGWVFGLAWLALLITIHKVLLKRAPESPPPDEPAAAR